MVFNYVFFWYLRKNRGNGNGAILIGLGRIIYFFNRVNNTIFSLSREKCLLDAVVVDSRQGSQISGEISLRNQPGRPSDPVPLGQLLLRI